MGTIDGQIEARTRALARDLIASDRGLPRVWERSWWDDHLMALTMADPATKVQLFRFVDALPALRAPATVRRHLAEYLDEAGPDVPLALRGAMRLAPGGETGDRLLAALATKGASRMAGRFIAGSTPEEAVSTVLKLRRRGRGFTADLLGEAVLTEGEADAYAATCLELLRTLSDRLNREPERPRIDRDAQGPIPRMNLSVKLSSLTPHFDPIHPEDTTEQVLRRLRPILRTAREVGAHVNVDMEQYDFRDLTVAIFREVLDEAEFRDWADAGIVVQAYLKDSLQDLEGLAAWADARGAPVGIRLVKGAYWDYEVTRARQLGWPVPVFEQKPETDANYERLTRVLLEHARWLRPAFGSHNVRSVAHALATAEVLGLPLAALEVQVLHGMGGALERTLVRRGVRVRIYTPYGSMLPGMAYLVRRLLENTSNDSFLQVQRSARHAAAELVRDPRELIAMRTRTASGNGVHGQGGALPPFRNEPVTDFARAEPRAAMQRALEEVRGRLGRFYPRHIVGSDPEKGPHAGLASTAAATPDETRHIVSRDPGNTARVVGFVPRCTAEEAEAALAEAAEAAPGWAETPARERAEVLLRAAEIMRRRRFELAAWEVFECAKPWREADADIAEAIDFCEFYAREMLRRGEPDARDMPGETNRIEHLARGVAVVIPPWNFPLAIPCGMTVAALVTGNATILKPAEQSPIIAWHLAAILREAGLPPGVLHYLPGVGEEVGPALVNSPSVDVIAFTGSREVGLLINRQAADVPAGQDHVKRVIAEMGGKNAIIVDDDADLDEAVEGVLTSAFGYAGQKCSACSRVIVLDGIHDAFLERLVEAAKTLTIGPADDPTTMVNPLIDADAVDRFRRYVEVARSEGRIVLEAEVPAACRGRGHYVGPVIVAGVEPEARIAQEEVFGPLLTVLKTPSLDQAIDMAHQSMYALTGGIYSRSPANLDRARRRFRVGNLYVNRPITGALVDRQPFGGFKLSGIGTKAGGSDYLNEFLLTRVVTENTMRRGFAPEEVAGVREAAAGI